MDTQKKVRDGGSREADVVKNFKPNSTPARPKKWERVLLSFLSGRAWHALEAARLLGTTCLHSDVADLERRGLRFRRERVSVAGYGGEKTSVTLYRLQPESYPLARDLLGVVAPQNPHDDDARAYMLASRGTRGAP